MDFDIFEMIVEEGLEEVRRSEEKL